MAEAELDQCSLDAKAAWVAGDIDKIMSMYADDCSFASNAGDIKKGKAQFRQDMAGFLAKYPSCDLKKVDRVICGNCATEMGTFACKQKSGTVDNGKYLAGYVKRDGKWLVRFDFSVFC